VKHRAAAFVDESKPADLFSVFEFDMFFRIHLPDLVRRDRSVCFDLGSSACLRRGEFGPREPSTQRPRRGDRFVGGRFQELNPDELGAPGGMFAAEVDRLLHAVGKGEDVGRSTISGGDACSAVAVEPLKQAIDGRASKSKPVGDLTRLIPFSPEPEHQLADRDGDGARHVWTSRSSDQEKESPHDLVRIRQLYQTPWPDFLLKLHVR